jgi:hypothetical protein
MPHRLPGRDHAGDEDRRRHDQGGRSTAGEGGCLLQNDLPMLPLDHPEQARFDQEYLVVVGTRR